MRAPSLRAQAGEEIRQIDVAEREVALAELLLPVGRRLKVLAGSCRPNWSYAAFSRRPRV
jgi:hypothetical protein